MTIEWRVSELVRARGWGARELAREAGIDEKTARNLIKGRATRVDVETIGRVAQALGVSPGPLWRDELSVVERWERIVGAAGHARPGEIDDVLSGRFDVDIDPGLERATRAK